MLRFRFPLTKHLTYTSNTERGGQRHPLAFLVLCVVLALLFYYFAN